MPNCFVRGFDRIDRCASFCVNVVASRLFGLPKKTGGTEYTEGDGDGEEWIGRLTYLERVFNRSLEQTKEDLTDELMSFEKRLYEHHVMVTNPDGSGLSETSAEQLESAA